MNSTDSNARAVSANIFGEDDVISAAHELVRDSTDPANCGEGETPDGNARALAACNGAAALAALLRAWGCEWAMSRLPPEARELYAKTASNLAREWLWARREEALRCHGGVVAADE